VYADEDGPNSRSQVLAPYIEAVGSSAEPPPALALLRGETSIGVAWPNDDRTICSGDEVRLPVRLDRSDERTDGVPPQ
jgi:hypothetical protein